MKLRSLLLLLLLTLTLSGEERVINRIFSSCAVANDILIRLGAGSQLAAIDEFGRIIDGTTAIPVIGRGEQISAEQLLALRINYAIVWNYQRTLQQQLSRLSIPFQTLEPPRLATYPALVDKLAKLTKTTAAAASLHSELTVQATTRSSTVKRPKVYLELYSPGKTVSAESYGNDLIELAGGENIGKAAIGNLTLSGEWILQQQPEVILFIDGFSTRKELENRPGFSALPAVRAGRIHAIDRKLLIAGCSPSEAVAFLHQLFYPEAAKE